MKKNFTKKLMAAAILLVTAVSPSWADYTITKSNGEPAVEGTDYVICQPDLPTYTYLELKSNDLVLSGEFDIAVFPNISDCKLTLKDVTITSNQYQGALLFTNTPANLVLEGTNRLVSTSETGAAIHVYNSGKDLTFTGSGELYMTSQKKYSKEDGPSYDCSCLFFTKMTKIDQEYKYTLTAKGFTIKGSTEYNADMSTLADVEVVSYIYEFENHDYHVCSIMIGDAVCNTVWMKGPEPDAEYVVVTNKEGQKAYYKTSDVEKIEWLKGEDITE